MIFFYSSSSSTVDDGGIIIASWAEVLKVSIELFKSPPLNKVASINKGKLTPAITSTFLYYPLISNIAVLNGVPPNKSAKTRISFPSS